MVDIEREKELRRERQKRYRQSAKGQATQRASKQQYRETENGQQRIKAAGKRRYTKPTECIVTTVTRDAHADEMLNKAVMQRGKQLTEMMRTPMCMWPPEWFDAE